MTKHGIAAIALVLIGALGSGCSTIPKLASFPENLPPAEPRKVQEGDYKIRAGDQIDIRFYYHPDHNQDNVLVGADGKIDLPLVGEVAAADQTPIQLAQELRRRFASSLRDPEVSVRVKVENALYQPRVYVGGEVSKPGFVTFRPGITVAQAVIEVGGFKDTAAIDSIVLLRKVGEPNEYKPSKINLERAIEEGDMQANIALGPSDILVVPKTPIAKINVLVEQYIIRMIPIRISITPI